MEIVVVLLGGALVLYALYAVLNNTLWAANEGRMLVDQIKGRNDPSIVRHTSGGDVRIHIVRNRGRFIVGVTSAGGESKVFGSYPTLRGATFVMHLIAESETALTDQPGNPLWE